MKAAILETINKPLIVEDVELTNLQIGQVLVKILISGLCGAQLQEIKGEKGNKNFVPHLLGHEGCGIVQEVGPGVTRLKPGDKVIMHWRKTNGIESAFPIYKYKNKTITSGKVTTLSQFSIVSENRLTPVEKDTPVELCALLGCGLSTALGTINYDADIKFGETVLVLGCGGVGLGLIMAANLAGASIVYGTDISSNKQGLVESVGGTFIQSIESINEKIDCIIDTTGLLSVVSNYLPLLSTRGRCIFICQPNTNNSLTFKTPNIFFSGEGQVIKATQGGKIVPEEDFKRYIKLYNRGLIKIEKLITHHIPLNDVNNAISLMKEGKAGRILITID